MIDHQNKIIFCHIPKTGGSSIESSFGLRKDHLYLKELRGYQKNHYRSFSFVRNPWDRIVSSFCFSKKPAEVFAENNRAEFENYVYKSYFEIKDPAKKEMDPQTWWIKNGYGEIDVDFIGRFENLNSDFIEMQKKFKISLPPIPHVNKTIRDHYSKYYSSKQLVLLVEDMYREEVELFGYSFEKE